MPLTTIEEKGSFSKAFTEPPHLAQLYSPAASGGPRSTILFGPVARSETHASEARNPVS
jgi:hypothetical protein